MTQIMATLGPASQDKQVIRGLVEAGARQFRLNFSHGDYAYFESLIKNVRALEVELGLKLEVVQDLCGAKLRVGQLTAPLELCQGQELLLTGPSAMQGIPISEVAVLPALQVGMEATMDDGELKLVVTELVEQGAVVRVVTGGTLTSRKGINIPGINDVLPALSAKDIADVKFALEQGIDQIMLSFVREAADVESLRQLIGDLGGKQGVHAKIETEAGVRNCEAIAKSADAIVLARGDLGAEIGLVNVPIVQFNIVQLVHGLGKPMLIASELLDSMNRRPTPTRAEVNDIATALAQGATGFIISDETAVGQYPIETIRLLKVVADQTQAALDGRLLTPWRG